MDINILTNTQVKMIQTVKIEISFATLCEVLEKTGNLPVATAMLEGTYVEPWVNRKAKRSSKPDKEGNYTRYEFQSYDKWTDKVTYMEDNGHWSREMPRSMWQDLENWVEEEEVEDIEATEDSGLPNFVA